MSHQPFETWVLDAEDLTTAERQSLREHLEGCAQCRRLEHKWAAVHLELRARRSVIPAPGFAQRFQASLAKRKAQEQRRQAWKIFGFFAVGALIILTMLAGYLASVTTPAEFMTALINTLSSSKAIFQYSLFIAQDWIFSTPLALNIAVWIYMTITLCALSLAWVTIFWRTKTVGELSQ